MLRRKVWAIAEFLLGVWQLFISFGLFQSSSIQQLLLVARNLPFDQVVPFLLVALLPVVGISNILMAVQLFSKGSPSQKDGRVVLGIVLVLSLFEMGYVLIGTFAYILCFPRLCRGVM